MIVQPSQLDRDELVCQVCIVGSGPAGIALALELARHQLNVVLVTGGSPEPTRQNDALYDGTVAPPRSHEPLGEQRVRAYGGGTKRWGGRLVPFDPIDFEQRPFVPASGWPISYDDVARQFSRAASLCEVVTDSFEQQPSAGRLDLPSVLGEGTIYTTSCERWSTPTDFGQYYRDKLAVMDHVRVLMDYHCVDVRLSEDRGQVTEIRVASRGGRPLRILASVFVLAAGAIENARLLLASRSQLSSGIGNHSDLVGRYYMSHLTGIYGWVRLAKSALPSFYDFHRDADGAYYRRRFRLSEPAQRRLQALNIIGFPLRPEIDDPRHGDAVLSLLYLQGAFTRAPEGERPSWGLVARHLANVAFNNPAAWASAVRQLRLRAKRPRLPCILPYKSSLRNALVFQGEHAPNPESRLVLGDQRDEFGMPRIEARIRFSDIDLETVRVFYRQLDRELRSAGLGRLEYDEAGLDEYLARGTASFNSISHHIGTTRMASNPKHGVVNADCKVHHVGNLYLAGSSVFPTSGHANPTLTNLALTLRLADHLADRLAPAATPATETVADLRETVTSDGAAVPD